MISSGLVKIYFTEGYYETSDIKTLCGVILNRTPSSVTVGILERQIILNWAHVLKIETIPNMRGSTSNFDFRKI